MIDRLLKSHLEPVARASQRWQLWRSLAVCWIALAALGWLILLVQPSAQNFSSIIFFLLIFAALAASAMIFRHFRSVPLDYQSIARQIERENPELHALLLTAVEQEPLEAGGRLNYLQQRVVLEALAHHRRSTWASTMTRRHRLALGAHWLGLAMLVSTLVALRPHFSFHLPGALWAGAERSNGVMVTPGDAKLERGSSLVVLAKFTGKLPVTAELVINPGNGQEQRVQLTKNLDDPVFGGGLPELTNDLKDRIEFGSGRTRDFNITLFEYPRLEHADVKITYPAYTKLPEKVIKNTRRVSALEGSTLDYTFYLNKPVVQASLVLKLDPPVVLTVDSNNPLVYHWHLDLQESHRYELALVDSDGRSNKVPRPEFVLEALKNKPASLALTSPRGDQTVSALEEISFQGTVTDDYGVKSYGIAYTLGGGETKSLPLGQETKPGEKRAFSYLLPLESLGAQPDEVLSYYVWAEDTGPDGQPRRTMSDIYFAEVKPFDQIFREAQQADAGAQQNGNRGNRGQRGGQGDQPDSLADLEKQIVTATFNLQRRETAPKTSDKYKDDVKAIQDGQRDALDQLRSMRDQNEDPRTGTYIDTAEKEMTKAATRLGEAGEQNSVKPLSSALASEQAAYQAVLKLTAREFQVARGQRGQRGNQQRAGNRMQRQLNQLDLAQNDNPYETQRQAPDNQQDSPQQQEQLQVANRLKELARRQQDLNQRVRELQASLQEARTEQDRADIRDRLKRLTEEQQNLLTDVDELRQRMDQQQDQQMSSQRDQLDQTRSQVQDAAQALGQNNPDQALASGTRAQQDFQQLQDQVRRMNSAQFTEEMRQMRNNARQLSQNEHDIANQLSQAADPNERKLTETDQERQQRMDLASRLLRQENGVSNLLNQMRDVSERSETAEPLLSQQLYDTIRQTSQDEMNSALESSSQLVRRGLVQQAGPYENRARRNIDQLATNVEQAADSLLGDGTEALRIAQRELDQLTQDLNQQLAQGGERGANGQDQAGSNQQPGQRGQRGNQGQRGQRGQGNQGEGAQPDQGGDQELAGQNPDEQNPGGGQPGGRRNGGNQGRAGGNRPGGQFPNGQNPQFARGNFPGDGTNSGQFPGGLGTNLDALRRLLAGTGTNLGSGTNLGVRAAGNDSNVIARLMERRRLEAEGATNFGGFGTNDTGQAGFGGDQVSTNYDAAIRQYLNQLAANGGTNGLAQALANAGIDPNSTNAVEVVRELLRRAGAFNGDTNAVDFAGGPRAGGERAGGERNGGGGNRAGGPRNGGAIAGGPGNWGGEYYGPLVDTNYVAWTDRLRSVEEMLNDVPDLSTQVAQIRDRARTLRLAYKRDGKKPDWAVVTTQISAPLAEVRARVDEELLKRTSKDALVPLDRDPVPVQYSERVRRYYEQLGKSD